MGPISEVGQMKVSRILEKPESEYVQW